MSIQAVNRVNQAAPQLAADEWETLLIIADWATPEGQWFTDMWRLSRKLGRDLPSTTRIVSELARKGYIRSGASGRVYDVMPTGRKIRDLPIDNIGPLFEPRGKE